MANKRILHICMAQYSDGWSYQENLLSKYHKVLGFDVYMLTSMYHYNKGKLVLDDKTEFVDCNGCKVTRLKTKSGLFKSKLPKYAGFYEFIKKIKPDIIFSHGVQYRDLALVNQYVNNNPNVVLYCDNHADFSNSATSFLSKKILHEIIWKHYAKKVSKNTKMFYGVMPSRVDFLLNEYKLPKEKVKLLVMGADDEAVKKALTPSVKNAIRSKYNIADDDFLIMTGGKIDLAKQQTLKLMEAVNKIDNPKVKLIVFGSVVDELKDAVNSMCSDKVQYIGWVESKNSYDYFGAADLVCFPGRHSVFWEQVAGLGIPMICKYWEGTTHVDVGGNVEFLKEGTTEELINVITKISSDKEFYANMLNAARNNAKQTFSYLRIAKDSIEV